MEMSGLRRLRVRFDDYKLLSKFQKSQGLKRCWLLLDPEEHDTISALASHLINNFSLHSSCPNGLILELDGYVLPPFESACILKDEDIIRVKRNSGTVRQVIRIGDNENYIEDPEIVEKQPALPWRNREVIVEFEKESEGDKSGHEEENPSSTNRIVKKKRKSSQLLQKSKRRKTKSPGSEKCPVTPTEAVEEVPTKENEISHQKNGLSLVTHQEDSSDANCRLKIVVPHKIKERRKKTKSSGTEKFPVTATESAEEVPTEQNEISQQKIRLSLETCQEDCFAVNGGSKVVGPHEVKERRKKSKSSGIEKYPVSPTQGAEEEVPTKQNEISQQKSRLSLEILQEDSSAANGRSKLVVSHEVKERADQLQGAGPESADTSKLPSRSARRKKAKRVWLREQAKLQKKELIQNCMPEKDTLETSSMLDKEKHEKSSIPEEEMHEKSPKQSIEDKIVPVIVRPGHIRFEPLGEGERELQNSSGHVSELLQETLRWNWTTSKKKGQRWGKEKVTTHKRNFDGDPWDNFYENTTVEEGLSVHDPINFEKLIPLVCSPKEGDTLAYRLVELSSSWCPELSAFRVGKISSFDLVSKRVTLVPIPKYPVFSDTSDQDAVGPPSAYNEDGSLEIDFSSLVDVRGINHGKCCSVTKTTMSRGDETSATSKSEPIRASAEVTPVEENGGKMDAWEELSKALDEKKSQLMQNDGWNKNGSSVSNLRSYRISRGSALGPTLAKLRAQNGL